MSSGNGMTKKRNPVLLVLDYLTDGMAVIAGVLITAMTLGVAVSVVTRYGFKMSVGWATEMIEYFLYTAVLLATPWVLKHDKHVRVDVVLNMLKPKNRRWLNLITDVAGLIAALVFCYYGCLAVHENFVKGTLMVKVLPVPKYVPLSVVPIMSVTLIYQFCLRIGRDIKWKPGDSSK